MLRTPSAHLGSSLHGRHRSGDGLSRRKYRVTSPDARASAPPRSRSEAWRSAATRITFALLVVAVVASGLNGLQIGKASAGIDFYQCWAAVEAARTMELENLYGQADRERIGAELLRRADETEGAIRYQVVAKHRKVLETNQSPWLYVALSPLNSGDYEADFHFYRHLCLLLTTASVIGLGVVLGLAAIDTLVVLFLVLTVFDPLRSDLQVGNVSQLQLAMLTVYVWIQSRAPSTQRDLVGGAILGFCIMFKPTAAAVAAVLGISWLVAGEWRKIRDQTMGAIAGAAVCAIVTGLYFGDPRIWLDFLATHPLADDVIPFAKGNWAPASVIVDLTGWHLAPLLLVTLLALTGWLLWQRRDALRASPCPDSVATALGCLVMLLASPVAWVHYYMVALLPLVMALQSKAARPRSGIAVLAAGVCVLPLLDSPLSQAGWKHFPHLFSALVSAGMLGLGALILRGLAAGTGPTAGEASA